MCASIVDSWMPPIFTIKPASRYQILQHALTVLHCKVTIKISGMLHKRYEWIHWLSENGSRSRLCQPTSSHVLLMIGGLICHIQQAIRAESGHVSIHAASSFGESETCRRHRSLSAH